MPFKIAEPAAGRESHPRAGVGSGESLEAWASREPRLRVENIAASELPAALEHGRSLARSPWIARHDADDLSHRRRLECQFAHGTALIRHDVLDRVGGWHERGWAEDLDLWIRMFEAGARFAKVKEPLYSWRQHRASSTRIASRYSRDRFTALKLAALDRGLLGGGRRALLIGVGDNLQRWRTALGARLNGFAELRRPPADLDPLLNSVLILALMSPAARERWRQRLVTAESRELRDFISVS